MMTLIAAALAAAQPAAAAPAEPMGQMPMMPMGQMPMAHMGQSSDHKAMPCCKDGCKDMTGKHDGDAGEHAGHAAN